MIVSGWTHRGLICLVFLALSRSVVILPHEPSSLFNQSVLVDLSISMMIH